MSLPVIRRYLRIGKGENWWYLRQYLSAPSDPPPPPPRSGMNWMAWHNNVSLTLSPAARASRHESLLSDTNSLSYIILSGFVSFLSFFSSSSAVSSHAQIKETAGFTNRFISPVLRTDEVCGLSQCCCRSQQLLRELRFLQPGLTADVTVSRTILEDEFLCLDASVTKALTGVWQV